MLYKLNKETNKETYEKVKRVTLKDMGWKEKIQKLQKGDTVFLYSSGEGIVAYGKADGKLNKVDEDGKPEFEYNMHLTDFKKLDTPISAAKIKEITHQGFIFTQTMFAVSEEAALKLIKRIKSKK